MAGVGNTGFLVSAEVLPCCRVYADWHLRVSPIPGSLHRVVSPKDLKQNKADRSVLLLPTSSVGDGRGQGLRAALRPLSSASPLSPIKTICWNLK